MFMVPFIFGFRALDVQVHDPVAHGNGAGQNSKAKYLSRRRPVALGRVPLWGIFWGFAPDAAAGTVDD